MARDGFEAAAPNGGFDEWRDGADMRLAGMEESKLLVLDGGVPPGYTLCVRHGQRVRCFDSDGYWVMSGGTCEHCWKQAHPGLECGSVRPKLHEATVLMGATQVAPQAPSVAHGGFGQALPLGPVERAEAEDALDYMLAGRPDGPAPPGEPARGAEASEPAWTDFLGFAESFLPDAGEDVS